MKGKIVFYHQIKGYGFIHTEDGKEFFFHISELEDYNPPQVNIDQQVEFETKESKKGTIACGIKKIGKEVQSGRKR